MYRQTWSCKLISHKAIGKWLYSPLFPSSLLLLVPTGTPENLSVIEITDRSAALMWDPPPPQSQNGIILGYVIFYAAADRPTDPRLTVSRTPFLTIGNDLQDSETFENSSGTPDCTLLEVAGTKGKINNLRPLTSYSVSVAAKTAVGIGPSSTALRVQTLKSGTCSQQLSVWIDPICDHHPESD